jgi:hypothetical protein
MIESEFISVIKDEGEEILAIRREGQLVKRIHRGTTTYDSVPIAAPWGWREAYGKMFCFSPDSDILEWIGCSRTLDGQVAAKFRVKRTGDVIRWIGKDEKGGKGYWDHYESAPKARRAA